MTTPAPAAEWFSVAQEKLRYTTATALLTGSLVWLVDVGLVCAAIATDGEESWIVGAVIATLAGLVVLVLFLMSRQSIRSADRALGVEDRGLWWREHGELGFIPWDDVRATQFGVLLDFQGRIAGVGLDVYLHRPPTDPVIEHLFHAGRYRMELNRAPITFLATALSPKLPPLVAAAISRVRPDIWIGPA